MLGRLWKLAAVVIAEVMFIAECIRDDVRAGW